ncbi:hypothetical protein [Litoreibacter janthinus]|uniref:Uncharacterized protein n=1 Tax=Litoreibacter janthinus TaxID=670154 RepID=A0A1I6G9Q1_9RHOB|nr:hypothetical protein [Litoreibacter janthinus]SFR38932.1 hypothetical protein SAMN04488002_1115 [Litoreibacter janthinus]
MQGTLTTVELLFFDKANEPIHLDRAEESIDAAREVFEKAQASHYIAMVDPLLATIQSRHDAL